MKQMWRIILGMFLFVAAVSVALFLLFPTTAPDTWVQYVGAILGGFATMFGVLFTLRTEKTIHDREYRPMVRLTLSDYSYSDPHDNFYCYFGRENSAGHNVSAGLAVIPLRIENFGKSDITVTEVRFIRTVSKTSDGQATETTEDVVYNFKDSDGNYVPAVFGIFSGESMDLPVKVNTAGKSSFQVELSYKNSGETAFHKKRYKVYLPRKAPLPNETYAEWVQKINIGKN